METFLLMQNQYLCNQTLQEMEQGEAAMSIEYFNECELIVNITHHELVPPHQILCDEEKKALLIR